MIQSDRPSAPQPPQGGAGRFVVAVFGFVFAGIGVTVLIFMWDTP